MLTEHVGRNEQKAPVSPTSPAFPALVIVGVGNEYRRDDAAGLLVARLLKNQLVASKPPSGYPPATSPDLDMTEVSVVECTGGSLELMDAWAGAHTVVLIDAMSSGADPGTVFRFEAHKKPIPGCLFHYSTHDFNIADTIELARLLGKLPPKVIIFGIEGADFGHGEGLSEDMAAAVEHVAHSALDYVRDCVRSRTLTGVL
ncbi:MAG: hydrogenase maturation protease [Chloroflexota bacterium]